MIARSMAPARKPQAAPLPPELLALTEAEVTARIKELEARKKQLGDELTKATTALQSAEHAFDQACEATKAVSRREADAISHVTQDRSPKATHELGVVQRELERAREDETTRRDALYDAISAERAIRASLAEVEPELDSLPRVIEVKRLDARIRELGPVVLAQHDQLVRTLIELAGLGRQAELLGLPPVNPRFFNGAGVRVDQALSAGVYQALPEAATKIRLESED